MQTRPKISSQACCWDSLAATRLLAFKVVLWLEGEWSGCSYTSHCRADAKISVHTCWEAELRLERNALLWSSRRLVTVEGKIYDNYVYQLNARNMVIARKPPDTSMPRSMCWGISRAIYCALCCSISQGLYQGLLIYCGRCWLNNWTTAAEGGKNSSVWKTLHLVCTDGYNLQSGACTALPLIYIGDTVSCVFSPSGSWVSKALPVG